MSGGRFGARFGGRGRDVAVGAGAVLAIATVGAVLHLSGGRAAAALVGAGAVGVLARRVRVDSTGIMVAGVVAVLLVPARLQLGPLGSSGTMASLVGAAAAGLWFVGRLFEPGWLSRERQPLRLALLVFVAAVLSSDLAMAYRYHDDTEERAALRGLIILAGMVGITLLIADGVSTRDRLRTVVKAVVGAGAVVALLGIAQFALSVDVAAAVRIPGFRLAGGESDFERSGFSRIVSTTTHPIELSVVLGMLLPLALHVAFTLRPGERRRLWWGAALTIAFAAPLTVSRTAVLALCTALAVVSLGWDGRRRLRVLGAAVLGVGVMQLVVPGLLGTLRSLLFSYGADPSISTRQSDYAYVSEFIAERPLFGRGWQTFLPERYTFLDNQFLLSMVEIGLLGTVALLWMFVLGAGQVLWVRHRSTDPEDRDLAMALVAAAAVSVVSWFTYDTYSFPTGRALSFVVLGLMAALWRLHRAAHPAPRYSRFRRARPPGPPAAGTGQSGRTGRAAQAGAGTGDDADSATSAGVPVPSAAAR